MSRLEMRARIPCRAESQALASKRQRPGAGPSHATSGTEAILRRGLMPLLSYRNAVRLLRFQSVADPATLLWGRVWPQSEAQETAVCAIRDPSPARGALNIAGSGKKVSDYNLVVRRVPCVTL